MHVHSQRALKHALLQVKKEYDKSHIDLTITLILSFSPNDKLTTEVDACAPKAFSSFERAFHGPSKNFHSFARKTKPSFI